ncbi:LysM peptidoglycan-binding domain-containing protein [Kangiella sp. TOML190]|uniref:LysM peptidoglycan-binding domain-containing protein n=1 Tax=Kangiella sp. TOML190 TaxID=2931351 RepID=UPI00203BC2BD|nr:LysM peptidoglycan-binding domain-containing protein [Kangiella sp. TOML190]
MKLLFSTPKPLKQTLLLLAFTVLSGCTFVEDRSQEAVAIIDAVETRKKPKVTEAAPKVKPVVRTYQVVAGDTLGKIAQKTLGSSQYYRQLADFNGLDMSTPLEVGQVLRLPPNSDLGTQDANSAIERKTRATNSAVTGLNKPLIRNYAALDQLIDEKKYNQAIDWAMSHPNLSRDQGLQQKLMLASKQQVAIEKQQGNYSEGILLIDGLTVSKKLSRANTQELKRLKTQLESEQLSQQAQAYLAKSEYPQAYSALQKAYQLDTGYALQSTRFINSRAQVSEQMHQTALKHYRNQELDQAEKIWDQILLIKPNDDLALVYKDRVVNLKKKLNAL